MLNSLITHTTPTGNILEAPELGTPRYNGQMKSLFPMMSTIEEVHCIHELLILYALKINFSQICPNHY